MEVDDFIDKLLYPDIDHVLIPIIWPIIVIIGLLGNFATITMLLLSQQLKTPFNVYILSLAFCDVTFLLVYPILPWYSYRTSEMHDAFYNGSVTNGICKLIYFLIQATFQISNFMVLCVTVERYLAICKPVRYRRLGTRRRAFIVSISVWILVSLFQSRLLWSVAAVDLRWPWPDGYRDLPNTTTICMYCSSGETFDIDCDVVGKLYVADIVLGLLVVAFVIPMYVQMIIKLRSSRFNTNSQNTQKPDRKVFNTLIVVVVVYVACFVPLKTLNLLYRYSEKFNMLLFVEYGNLSRTPMLINAAINPIIYMIMNTTYRNALISLVKKPRSPDNTAVSDVSLGSV